MKGGIERSQAGGVHSVCWLRDQAVFAIVLGFDFFVRCEGGSLVFGGSSHQHIDSKYLPK